MWGLRPRKDVEMSIWLYTLERGTRVLILGGEGRLGHVTPPVCSSTLSR